MPSAPNRMLRTMPRPCRPLVGVSLLPPTFTDQLIFSRSLQVCRQVITATSIIMGRDGTKDGQTRIQQLAFNAKYFREGLKKMGLVVFGA